MGSIVNYMRERVHHIAADLHSHSPTLTTRGIFPMNPSQIYRKCINNVWPGVMYVYYILCKAYIVGRYSRYTPGNPTTQCTHVLLKWTNENIECNWFENRIEREHNNIHNFNRVPMLTASVLHMRIFHEDFHLIPLSVSQVTKMYQYPFVRWRLHIWHNQLCFV